MAFHDAPELKRRMAPDRPVAQLYSMNTGQTGPQAGSPYMLGEVVAYQRKSNDDSRAAASIADQVECNFETAAEWGLPLDAHGIMSEKPGHGGNEWWLGGGSHGIENYNGPKAATRPILTKIIAGVTAHRIRVIIVWSVDRLFRHIGICEAMIEILNDCGCSLFDRNGPVDITTPHGKNALRAAINAAQNMREMAVEGSPRGIRKTRNRGKMVVSGNRLRFRGSGLD